MANRDNLGGTHRRVTITGSRYEGGRLLVSGTGLAGDGFKDMPWSDAHGFHSRPKDGAEGYLVIPGGNADQAHIVAATSNGNVPELGKGESAMYDGTGRVARLGEDGWAFDGNVEITGNLSVTGNINSGGDMVAGGAMTSGAPDSADE